MANVTRLARLNAVFHSDAKIFIRGYMSLSPSDGTYNHVTYFEEK